MAQIKETTISGNKPYTAPVDTSVDPYGVQQSGETGAVIQPVASIIDPSNATGYAAGAYDRAVANANIPVTTVTGNNAPASTNTTADGQPNIPDPYGGEGVNTSQTAATIPLSEDDKRAIAWQTNPGLMDIATEMQNINNNPDLGDAQAPDPYGVNAWDAARDAKLQAIAQTQAVDTGNVGLNTGNGTTGGYTGGGGGTSTGGGTTGGTGGNATGGTGTGTNGDQLFQQAATMKFSWDAATDPDYQLNAKQAESQIASMMTGRNGLWSSVTQNALTTRLFELQATYRNAAYDKFKDERSFYMQMADMQYGREDEAWNRQMESLKYQADREDAAFSKSMQQQNLELSYARMQFDQQMQKENQYLSQAQDYVNSKSSLYAQQSGDYNAYLAEWQSTGRANNAVASYFGVSANTSITSTSGKNAIASKGSALSKMYNEVATVADNTNNYNLLLKNVSDYMSQSQSVTDGGGTAASAPSAVYNQAKSQLYTYTDLTSYRSGFYDSLVNNAQFYLTRMSATEYNALVALADKRLEYLANRQE